MNIAGRMIVHNGFPGGNTRKDAFRPPEKPAKKCGSINPSAISRSASQAIWFSSIWLPLGLGANLAEWAFITIMDNNVFLLDNGLTKSFCQFFLCSFL